MQWYLVITPSPGDNGLRSYSVFTASPVEALRDAIFTDLNDFPDNPSKFTAVEVVKSVGSVLSL